MMISKRHYIVNRPDLGGLDSREWKAANHKRGDIIPLPEQTCTYPNNGGWQSAAAYIKARRNRHDCIETLENGLVFDLGSNYGLRLIQTVTIEGETK